MEQRLKSMPTASDPPELQKSTLGPARAGSGVRQRAPASWHESTGRQREQPLIPCPLLRLQNRLQICTYLATKQEQDM